MANAIFQVNLFPTLIILELLKHANYNDGLTKATSTNIAVKASRHTVVNVAGQMGMNQEQVDELLNHKIKGVNKFYWTKQQTATDVSPLII